MRFEIGKFYQHTSGQMISVVCQAETTMYGITFLAEQSDSPDFISVGSDSDEYAENWEEITKEQWMKGFTDD